MFTSTLRAVLRDVIVEVVNPQLEQSRAEMAGLRATVERLDKRIDNLGSRLDARIDDLTKEVASLRTTSEVAATMSRRLERLEDHVFRK